MSITFNVHAPIRRQVGGQPSATLADSTMTWSRTTRWVSATAKQVFPAIAVLTGAAAAVAATIGLRLAIWLPLHLPH